MKSLRVRTIRQEDGFTLTEMMVTTMIMIVLIGVMGAGLLTFVSTDLNTVLEANQGQRAFEMADAGVQAAEQQLRKDPKLSSYDGGGDDVPWAVSTGGVNLTDLDGNSATQDKVNVVVSSQGSPDKPIFRVI